MLNVSAIGSYIPSATIDNYEQSLKFDVNDGFIDEKIGIATISRMDVDMPSDLCVRAFEALQGKSPVALESIECICLVTQNGDAPIPHTTAILHDKLGLPTSCACFDIALGCSGYVYALDLMMTFMDRNNMKTGTLFTCDPYSKIIDPDDKNTSLLFGDAATATLISEAPGYIPVATDYRTIGRHHDALVRPWDGPLSMKGRKVCSFVMRNVPPSVHACLERANTPLENVDLFLFHQASKFVCDNLVCKMELPKEKAPFEIANYGNTVSSTIPLLWENRLHDPAFKTVLLSGFGVGLSVASMVVERSRKE